MSERSGLDANVFDTEGVRISSHKNWVNPLCPEIKATDKGQSFICAVAHQNLAVQVQQTRKPVIEECDAGLIKMVVPIFIGDEFVGAACACGLLLEGGEVDAFLISKITEIEEERIESLAKHLRSITEEEVRSLMVFTEKRVGEIVGDFEKRCK